MSYQPQTALGRAVNQVEETAIAVILGLMTLITFANVIARYVLNSTIIWGLEVTSFLFAWLVLLGASYAVKSTSHLGVDVIVNAVPPASQRVLGLLSAAVCIAFSLLLLKGAWDFWAPYGEMSPTAGRWFPLGFETVRGQGWYELNDTPIPGWLNQPLADVFNMGERYEKLPRLVPYAILPLAMLLLSVRFIVAGWEIAVGTRKSLIVSHEVEDEIAEAQEQRLAQEQAEAGRG